MEATTAEIRRELQQLLSTERDLLHQAEHATSSGEYQRLRDLAEELVEVVERRVQLRDSLVKSRARDSADERSVERKSTDQSAETWRLLR
jgi:ElaB/YqjD/DUF883 family membrane-anchored ribosome-binding protein